MKKFGFTLAEVLITLGIIGVVASLTAPALVMSSRNEANAAKLAVIVSNLENAFSNAIVQEGVDNLFQTRMWTNVNGGNGINADKDANDKQRFVGELGRYLNINGAILDGTAQAYKTYYGSKSVYGMIAESGGTNTSQPRNMIYAFPGDTPPFPIIMKNGAGLFIRTFSQGEPKSEDNINDLIAQGTNYIYNAADVFIDVNGPSAPNTFGRDIFGFEMSEKGVLYPLGGMDVAILMEQNIDHVWSKSGHHYSCITGNFGEQGNDANGLGCTARLIAEGYKMNY